MSKWSAVAQAPLDQGDVTAVSPTGGGQPLDHLIAEALDAATAWTGLMPGRKSHHGQFSTAGGPTDS